MWRGKGMELEGDRDEEDGTGVKKDNPLSLPILAMVVMTDLIHRCP